MNLHAKLRIFIPLPLQPWRGLSRFMQLHLKWPLKRAGVAGRALRASDST